MSSQDQLPPTIDSEQANPFAAPQAELMQDTPTVDGEIHLATRGSRFVAAFVDGFLMIALIGPLMYFGGVFTRGEALGIIEGFGWNMVGLVLYVLVNGYHLNKNGQTLGKLLMKIRICRTSGEKASLGHIILRRVLPMNLVSLIPVLGNLLTGFVDPLLIFRGNYKCLHDDIADTVVVMA